MATALLAQSFCQDSALIPLSSMSTPWGGRLPPLFGFYYRNSFLWGTDGLNHAALSSALLSHFTSILHELLSKKGRGALFSLIRSDEICRNMVVTDNHTNRATILPYKEALSLMLARNFFPSDD